VQERAYEKPVFLSLAGIGSGVVYFVCVGGSVFGVYSNHGSMLNFLVYAIALASNGICPRVCAWYLAHWVVRQGSDDNEDSTMGIPGLEMRDKEAAARDMEVASVVALALSSACLLAVSGIGLIVKVADRLFESSIHAATHNLGLIMTLGYGVLLLFAPFAMIAWAGFTGPKFLFPDSSKLYFQWIWPGMYRTPLNRSRLALGLLTLMLPLVQGLAK
jgi:hypothetical protein